MKQYAITLVHGTFARNAEWTKEGSPLRTFLTKALDGPVRFHAIEWPGWNTEKARAAATTLLRRHLAEGAADDCRHYIIGHSHGGNVALHALGQPDLQDRVSGVVCLNTPFFAVFKRNTTQLLLTFFPIVALLVLYVVFGLYLAGPLQAAIAPWPRILRVLFLTVFGGIFGLVISFSLVLGWTLASRITEWTSRKRQQFAASIELPDNPKVPVLCLWAAGDEVTSWFQLFDTLAELPYMFLSPVALLAIFAALVALQLSGTLPPRLPGFEQIAADSQVLSNVLAETNELEEKRRAFLGLCLLSGALYTVALSIALTVLGLVLNLPFRTIATGIPIRKFFYNSLVRVAFTPVPVSSHRVEFLDLESQSGLLSHSKAYHDEAALQKMVDWIMSR